MTASVPEPRWRGTLLWWPRLLGSITRAELVFSLKCFAAAMLAMYVASRAGLPRPFWSMLTAYVVANPMAGAVRSKALYRFCGTLIGSTATVLIVPALSNTPELTALALALWVALCLYVSLLDRTPRAYLFMLAGYTAALIGFPSVETPTAIFDTALARVEEIGLGILCASLVHSLLLPTGLAPAVLGLLDRTARDSRQWLHDVLRADAGEGAARQTFDADRRRLAADVTQLRMLSTHVPFDTSHLRWTSGALAAMQHATAALTSLLAAVDDRLQALREAEGDLAPDVQAMTARVDAWVQTLPSRISETASPVDEAQVQALLADVRALGVLAGETPLPAWSHALRLALASRLEELVLAWQRCAELRDEIGRGLGGAPVPTRRLPALGAQALHRDRGLALLSATAAALAVLACCAIWIATGWRSGSAMAMMAAVFCSFFATMDDPVPMIHGFLKGTLWSVPLAAAYVLAMPLVQDFGMLVLLCAPVFLLLGCFIPRATPGNLAMPILFGVAGALSMHDTATADLVNFANSMLAQVLGVVAAARMTALVRSIGADVVARRIQRASWRELAELSAPAGAGRRQLREDSYAARLLDRIGLLAPRIAQAGGRIEGVVTDDALRDLRAGADIVALQRARSALPKGARAAVLAQVAAFFEALQAGRRERPAALQQQLDAALQGVLAEPTRLPGEQARAVAALVGLRRNLCPGAPPPQGLTMEMSR
ncbi:FUSC family protein [Ideonella azotifigens]|uniref:FUSC family protein n=2 Tax=Ideonella azotifigens TaxID=513160 RepID=A0ABN1KJM2_9BURK|nr:FUSC family protein [Ideonella azotifigens]